MNRSLLVADNRACERGVPVAVTVEGVEEVAAAAVVELVEENVALPTFVAYVLRSSHLALNVRAEGAVGRLDVLTGKVDLIPQGKS